MAFRTIIAAFFLGTVCILVSTGCVSRPPQKSVMPSDKSPAGVSPQLVQTSVPPASRKNVFQHNPKVRVKWWQKLNPLFWARNADDPDPPEWYRPGEHGRRFKWHCRNPGHNFTFYVIGITDKEFERAGHYPDDVFNPRGGWNWAVCRYKCVRLPFISFKGERLRFYLGWRERGNFGAKFTFSREMAGQGIKTAENFDDTTSVPHSDE